MNALIERTRQLVTDFVLPIEDKHGGDVAAAGGDDLRVGLQAAARDARVFCPHGPREFGGLGLNMTERARVFEVAGHSLFGPLALNAAAPDEGNMHLLAEVANEAQRQEFLGPLVRGEVRSAFAMSEPPPGAGSDPRALATTATKVPGGWRINGRKRWITGADGAAFLIIMARTSGSPGDKGGATMFLAQSAAAGLVVQRHVETLDRSMIGGHCELAFDDLFVPGEAVLGDVDEGFAYAQVRLGPARMTHVMRWLGSAQRAQDVALQYVVDRQAFGSTLSQLGMIQQLIADNEVDLAASRALLMEACGQLDAGCDASTETSIAKTFAAEAICRVVDRAMQMCGGLGVSEDLPLARLSREVRPFRIYDGPSEVHRWSIARAAIRGARAVK